MATLKISCQSPSRSYCWLNLLPLRHEVPELRWAHLAVYVFAGPVTTLVKAQVDQKGKHQGHRTGRPPPHSFGQLQAPAVLGGHSWPFPGEALARPEGCYPLETHIYLASSQAGSSPQRILSHSEVLALDRLLAPSGGGGGSPRRACIDRHEPQDTEELSRHGLRSTEPGGPGGRHDGHRGASSTLPLPPRQGCSRTGGDRNP